MKRKKRIWPWILLTAAVANAVSFAVVRSINPPKVILEVARPAGADGRMNYLIAGTFNQPRTAFGPLLDRLEGGITLVTFDTMGWDPYAAAQAIVADIWQGGYDPVLYMISVGDKVARWMDSAFDDLKTVAINPCPAPEVLKTSVRVPATIAVPVFRRLCDSLGWLSAMPCFPSASGEWNYSAILFADQLKEVLSDNAPRETSKVVGIIQSSQDGLLDNDKMVEYFGETQRYFTVDCGHADTVNHAQDYQEAIRKIEELAELADCASN